MATETPVVPCSRGLVALTFDDGPRAPATAQLLDVLEARRVPATFFVVGGRVQTSPHLVRRTSALGHVVGNHTYGHEMLTRLSSDAIRRTLSATRRAVRAAGGRPSDLVRSPYGAESSRVLAVFDGLGLVPVRWSVDPRDWAGRSSSAIAGSVLEGIRPHATNVVLLHDGVANSPSTVRALPAVIRGARARGYCFATLGPEGRPVPPVPRATARATSVQEQPGGSFLTVTVRLDRPTSRRTSAMLRTVPLTATEGADYVPADVRVAFGVGAVRQTVAVRVRDDLRDEDEERIGLRLSHPRGLRVPTRVVVGRIVDEDPAPRAAVGDAGVVEPGTGAVDVTVPLSLSRASERWVTLTVTTAPGSADASDYVPVEQVVRFAPGERQRSIQVTIVADTVVEGPETFAVRVVSGVNVDVAGVFGTVTIQPPTG